MKQEQDLKRIHPCLIESLANYATSIGVPKEYGQVAGLHLISTILGRRVRCLTPRGEMFLRRFQLIVGSPGSGKSLLINTITDVLKETKLQIPSAPSSTTVPALIDFLASDGSKRQWGKTPLETISTCSMALTEYALFANADPTNTLDVLMCQLWDGTTFVQTLRSRPEPIVIERPHVNMIGAIPPERFMAMFPREHWAGGYVSRVSIVYLENEIDDSDFYATTGFDTETSFTQYEDLTRSLAHDLQHIGTELFDKNSRIMPFTPEAEAAKQYWMRNTRHETAHNHPQLIDYNNRRGIRRMIDAALFCISRAGTDWCVSLSDWEKSCALHATMDASLVDLIFKMQSVGNTNLIEAAWLYIFEKGKGGIMDETQVATYLMGHTKTHHEARGILDFMKQHEVVLPITHGEGRIPGVKIKYNTPKLKANLDWYANQSKRKR